MDCKKEVVRVTPELYDLNIVLDGIIDLIT